MLTLTTDSWKYLPTAQMAPYDQNDLVIFLSSKVALLLKNIIGFDKSKFSICSVMTSSAHRETFFTADELKTMTDAESEKKAFSEKQGKFAAEMGVLLERFFITNKMPRYLFFDEKEQSIISDVLAAVPWFCQVIILREGKDGFKGIDIKDLSPAGIKNLKKMLGGIKLKAELSFDEYLRYKGKRITPNRTSDEIITQRILKVYPELNAETLSDFNRAVKLKKKELHPDLNKTEGASEKFDKFNKAVEQLKETKWYRNLK